MFMCRGRFLKIEKLFLLTALLCQISIVQAESPYTVMHLIDTTSPVVAIKVRVIRATNPIVVGSPLTENAKASYQIDMDEELSDISLKLRHLQFLTFKMVSKDELLIPLKKKESVNLSDRTVLTIRPIYLSDNRVGMWLKWTDKSGEQVLLDTRMHFDSEESMLAGTENHSGDGGLILAISAQPK